VTIRKTVIVSDWSAEQARDSALMATREANPGAEVTAFEPVRRVTDDIEGVAVRNPRRPWL
jgi:hypothetical protein